MDISVFSRKPGKRAEKTPTWKFTEIPNFEFRQFHFYKMTRFQLFHLSYFRPVRFLRVRKLIYFWKIVPDIFGKLCQIFLQKIIWSFWIPIKHHL